MINFMLLFFCVVQFSFANAAEWSDVLPALQKSKASACDPKDPLCMDPFKAVCVDTEVPNDSKLLKRLRNQVAHRSAGDAFQSTYLQLQAMENKNETTTSTLSASALKDLYLQQQKSIVLIRELQQKILFHYDKSEADLTAQYAKNKNALLGALIGSPVKIARLKSVRLKTAENFAEEGTKFPKPEKLAEAVRERSLFISRCGSDGLQKNASLVGNDLFLCPGLLFQSLERSSGKLNHLSFAMSHEIGHSIGPMQDASGKESRMGKFDYDAFSKCMQTFVQDPKEHFGNSDETINQLTQSLPRLRSEIARLELLTPVPLEELAELNRAEIAASKLMGNLQKSPKEFAENIRQDEMAADYYGSLALLRQMKETPVGQRRSLVIESLKNVCEQGRSSKRINTLIFGEVNEPLYPPARFRVENALRNSELRAGLGCQAYTKTDRPWCDLQGASEN